MRIAGSILPQTQAVRLIIASHDGANEEIVWSGQPGSITPDRHV